MCCLLSASLSTMSICTRVVVAVALQQVDCAPDAKTSTQCDDESLKNGYCAVKKCHKCVPPCTMRPYGLMNCEHPPACAPANGQTYSQVSNPNQKPGYVKRRQLAAPSYSVVSSAPMTSSSPEQTYLARSASTTSYLSPGLSFRRWSRNASMLNVFFLSAPAVSL